MIDASETIACFDAIRHEKLVFADLVELAEIDPGAPMVPNKTYKRSGFDQWVRLPGDAWNEKHKKRNFDEGERPVLMRGAWFRMANKYQVKGHFIEEVKERYARFYKLTAMNENQAQKHADKLRGLMNKKSYKRRVYWSSTSSYNGADESDFYQSSYEGYFCFYMMGIWYRMIPKDKFQAMKAIYRNINKLETLINSKERKEKWQQLIQQVI